MGNVGSCVGRQAASPVSGCSRNDEADGARSAATSSGMAFHAEAGTPRAQGHAPYVSYAPYAPYVPYVPYGPHVPVPAGAEAIAARPCAARPYVRTGSSYGAELRRNDSEEALAMAGRPGRANAASLRSSFDSLLDDAASLSSQGEPAIVQCFALEGGSRNPDHKGLDYRAYYLERETGYPDWLVVSDDDAQPEGFRKTHNHLCQLMLLLKGVGLKDGVARLKRYDCVASKPLPAAPLPTMSRFDLADAVRGYLQDHVSIVLQVGQQAMVISSNGPGRELGDDGLTILDPKARSCVAVFRGELADVILQICPPALDEPASADAGADADVPPSPERPDEPASGMRGGRGVEPCYSGCMVSHLPPGGHANAGYEDE